jgi:hypothetical protein
MISTIVKIKNMRSSYRTNANFLARLADAFAHRVRAVARVGGAKSGSKLPHSTGYVSPPSLKCGGLPPLSA